MDLFDAMHEDAEDAALARARAALIDEEDAREEQARARRNRPPVEPMEAPDVDALRKENLELRAENAALRERIEELLQRLDDAEGDEPTDLTLNDALEAVHALIARGLEAEGIDPESIWRPLDGSEVVPPPMTRRQLKRGRQIQAAAARARRRR